MDAPVNINYLNHKTADELRQLIIEKELEYQTFKAKIRTVVQRANQLRTENETLQQQVSVNSKLIESMEADILRQQQQIKTSNEEIAKLNEKYKKDTQQLVSAIHQLKDKKALLEKQLASPRAGMHTRQSPTKGEDRSASEDNIDRLTKHIEKLTLERDKMKKLVQELEKDSITLRETNKEKELMYKAQIQKLKETVEELKKQNNQSTMSYPITPNSSNIPTKDPYTLNHSNQGVNFQKPAIAMEEKKEFLDPALAFGIIQNVPSESTKKKKTHKSTMKTPVSKSFDANSFNTPDKKIVSERKSHQKSAISKSFDAKDTDILTDKVKQHIKKPDLESPKSKSKRQQRKSIDLSALGGEFLMSPLSELKSSSKKRIKSDHRPKKREENGSAQKKDDKKEKDKEKERDKEREKEKDKERERDKEREKDKKKSDELQPSARKPQDQPPYSLKKPQVTIAYPSMSRHHPTSTSTTSIFTSASPRKTVISPRTSVSTPNNKSTATGTTSTTSATPPHPAHPPSEHPTSHLVSSKGTNIDFSELDFLLAELGTGETGGDSPAFKCFAEMSDDLTSVDY